MNAKTISRKADGRYSNEWIRLAAPEPADQL